VGEKFNRWAALIRILILVEGQTEEAFVKAVLQPHLITRNIILIPTIVETKRVIGAASHKGGGDFSKIKGDISSLLNDSNAVAVTTLFDFYGFPETAEIAATAYNNIAQLEQQFEAVFNNRRFKAYLQAHEFEAFLFIDPAITAKAALNQMHEEAIQKHRDQFNHVEEINLGIETAPSKRLKSILGKYNKPRIGAKVTEELGCDRLKNECPKFANWLDWMLSLAPRLE
jgi:hypothetical protein